MGCSYCKVTSTISYPIDGNNREIIKTNNYKVKSGLNFQKNIDKLDLSNKLKDISEYYSLFQNDLPFLEYLNLSNNNLSDISELKSLKAPKIKILDLSNNQIDSLEVFRELKFPLEELYLQGNCINQIKIFEEIDILKKLKKCYITVNDNINNNKEILSRIGKLIKEFKNITIKEINTKKIEIQRTQKKIL